MRTHIVAKSAFGLVLAVAASGVSIARQPTASVRKEVEIQVQRNVAAWNSGSIERFMVGYVRSRDTLLVSGSDVVLGFDAIKDALEKAYGSAAKMGHLSVEIEQIRVLDAAHAFVLQRFHLHRKPADGGDASGLVTQIFVKTADGWRVMTDRD